jgi:hypothetical protein
MCSIKWKATSNGVELEVFCHPVYVSLNHHQLQQGTVSNSLVIISMEKEAAYFAKINSGNFFDNNIFTTNAEVSGALTICEAVVHLYQLLHDLVIRKAILTDKNILMGFQRRLEINGRHKDRKQRIYH